MDSIAFDATTPIHFARSGRLSELLAASADNEPVLLAEVGAELTRGAAIALPLDAASEARLKRADLDDLAELAAFATYRAYLGGGPERNNGEAAVLAWISVHGGIAIIDEDVARNLGIEELSSACGSFQMSAQSTRRHHWSTISGHALSSACN